MMQGMPTAAWFAVGLGTNLPFDSLEGPALLQQAMGSIQQQSFSILSRSGFWRSPAWPDPNEPAYTNAVCVCLADQRRAEETLQALQQVEQAYGRQRARRWGARTLDLDLLDFHGLRVAHGALHLPHPRMSERAFVLAPLAEAAPWWRHPESGRSAQDLLAALGECAIVRLHGC